MNYDDTQLNQANELAELAEALFFHIAEGGPSIFVLAKHLVEKAKGLSESMDIQLHKQEAR